MILGSLIVVPILAGLALFAMPRSADIASKWIAVAVAFGAFLLAAFNAGVADESIVWLQRPFSATFHVGLGGPGFWLVLLLTLATGCATMVARVPRARDFAAQILMLQGAMTGVFLARDLMLFALFWDLMLIPVFMTLVAWAPGKTLVAGGGSTGRPVANATAWRYLIYNLVGGLALLVATAAYGVVQGTTDVIGRDPHALPAVGGIWATWIFAGFALAFLIKTPVWPLHTWMPDTYADLPAPMAATVSAVQSKAGLYGFIVIGLPLLSGPMHAAAPLMIVLGLIGLVYGAFSALVQDDTKRVFAYSSLSHLGLILIAIFSFDPLAIGGAIVYLVAHGLFSAGLFMTIGEVETREETRLLSRLGGLGTRNPRLAGGLTIVVLAALGLPGLCGFAGEILILTGLYHAGLVWQTIVALVPIVIAAAYMLRVFQGVMHGPEVDDIPHREDMSPLEMLALAPLVAAIVLLGVNPGAVARSFTGPAVGSIVIQDTPATASYTLNGAMVQTRSK